jgi:MbtH protein
LLASADIAAAVDFASRCARIAPLHAEVPCMASVDMWAQILAWTRGRCTFTLETRRRDMAWDEAEDATIYKVVVNHEEQYSIWPSHRENPLGWQDAGKTGSKSECLEYIQEVWVDMRPLSLRKHMAGEGSGA